ncbi:Protein kinase domain protein [Kalmanozyma brasiliensis GHG001]|uniref:Protein kinase n=1 Tax=Kalmanozyma brasiliensis (strain GHG001) TaxID=1365824 RepID=V5GTM5_KALBG|nr:Protein kinase domain protein [Kalmanozyma brasiliensis GHG001]EST09267.1 Protein kinase domain protein [Kalmanozyma brasiliensis GHG001]
MDSAAAQNLAVRNLYAKIEKVGEGTYASVFLARNIKTNQKVAIKKIKIVSNENGMDVTAIREVKFLKELDHPNVIKMVDVFSSGSASPSLNLVLEFLDTNLEALIKDKTLIFTQADIKGWMAMLCRGMEYCHRHWVLHRDLKPNNLLISPSGELKIADFGLAREHGDPGARMTHQVVTRWYRPPELLLGSRAYSSGVDMWSVGCIFAELMLRVPYLPGESDAEQLNTIFKALGTPSEKDWPCHKSLPDYKAFEQHPKSNLADLFLAASPEALDFLQRTLLFDPLKRLSANQALHHQYFKQSPPPTSFKQLPRHPTKALDPDDPASHPLLSDSKEKNEAREKQQVRGNGGNKRPLDAKEIEERKRLARKLAFE